jgi:hypothetical protein
MKATQVSIHIFLENAPCGTKIHLEKEWKKRMMACFLSTTGLVSRTQVMAASP